MVKIESYVIFEPGDFWPAKILKKGFGHISVMAFDGINWIHFNPAHTHLEWEILPFLPTESPFSERFQDATIVKIVGDVKRRKWILRFKLMSCLVMVNYYLGIRRCSLTPYKLYKYLINKKIGEDYDWKK